MTRKLQSEFAPAPLYLPQDTPNCYKASDGLLPESVGCGRLTRTHQLKVLRHKALTMPALSGLPGQNNKDYKRKTGGSGPPEKQKRDSAEQQSFTSTGVHHEDRATFLREELPKNELYCNAI